MFATKTFNPPQNTTIIILHIKIEIYNFISLFSDWETIEELQICPACRKMNFLKRFSNYMKYYYQVQIRILVVKCHNCGTHHAIIPSFSLPGTSLGTKEVEIFYEKRASGSSRNEAGEELLKKRCKSKTPEAY